MGLLRDHADLLGGGRYPGSWEYERTTLVGLAFWPYARMSLVGGVLLLGLAAAGLLPGLGRGTGFALVMVLLKLGADVLSHSLEHRWFLAEQRPGPVGSM